MGGRLTTFLLSFFSGAATDCNLDPDAEAMRAAMREAVDALLKLESQYNETGIVPERVEHTAPRPLTCPSDAHAACAPRGGGTVGPSDTLSH